MLITRIVRANLAAATAVLLAASGTVVADRPQEAPSARQVIARYVAAIGGEAAFKAVRSVHQTGRLSIAAQGLGGEFAVFASRPGKLISRLTVPGIGKIESGYDGTIGWLISPMAGPELLSGRQLSEAAEDAWFDEPLHGPDRVQTLETVGRAEFDGHQVVKVHVVFRSGQDQFEYFDAATGLEIGSDASRATPEGIVPTVNVLRDYRAFGDIKWPTTLVQRALGIEQVVTIASCDYNSVPPATFDPPAEVRALVAR